MTDEEIAELLHYTDLLAWIMQPVDDRSEVEDTAVHVWRVELTVQDHARLNRYLTDEHREMSRGVDPDSPDLAMWFLICVVIAVLVWAAWLGTR